MIYFYTTYYSKLSLDFMKISWYAETMISVYNIYILQETTLDSNCSWPVYNADVRQWWTVYELLDSLRPTVRST